LTSELKLTSLLSNNHLWVARKTLYGSGDHLLVIKVLLVHLFSISVGQLPLKSIRQLLSRLATNDFRENRLIVLLQGKVFLVILLDSLLALLNFFEIVFDGAVAKFP
jgi:hypothetical protein